VTPDMPQVEHTPLGLQDEHEGVMLGQLAQRRVFGSRYQLPWQLPQVEVARYWPGEHEVQLLIDWLQERHPALHWTQLELDIT
jgi:hypothetical protein